MGVFCTACGPGVLSEWPCTVSKCGPSYWTQSHAETAQTTPLASQATCTEVNVNTKESPKDLGPKWFPKFQLGPKTRINTNDYNCNMYIII